MTTATLGFAIDSSQAVKGAADLDKLTAASKKAETAAAGLAQQNGAVAAMAKRAGVSYEEMQQRITKAAQPLRDAQASAVKGAVTLQESFIGRGGSGDGLAPAADKAEKSSRSLADTLTRRFVVGYAVSQIRSLGASLVSLAADTARIGDIGKLTGFGSADVQGITSAAAGKGIAPDAFAGAIVAFNQQIPLAKAGIGSLGELLRANKVTVSDTADAFFKVADLVKNAKDDTARMAVLQQAGLPATLEMARFMGQGAEAIRRQSEGVAKLTDEQIAAARKVEDRFNELWTAFSTGGKKATVDVIGALGDLVTWWQGKVGQMVSPMELLIYNMNNGGGSRMSQADADAFYGATGADKPGRPVITTNKPTVDSNDRAKFAKQISDAQMRIGLIGSTPTVADIAALKQSNTETKKTSNNDGNQRAMQRAA